MERDDTINVLSIALKYLPTNGRIHLMEDITSLQDDDKLRQLRDHFVDAILKPSKTRQVIYLEGLC